MAAKSEKPKTGRDALIEKIKAARAAWEKLGRNCPLPGSEEADWCRLNNELRELDEAEAKREADAAKAAAAAKTAKTAAERDARAIAELEGE